MNEQQLRHVIKQVVGEVDSTLVTEYGRDYRGELYKAFVEPFVDVAKGAKLFSQDILNSLRLGLTTLTTLSPKKLVEARDKYNKRREVISKEWEPLMKRARESVEGSDLGVVTFALAPTVFFGLQLGKMGGKAPGTIIDYLEKAGWSVPILSKIRGAGLEAEKRMEREQQRAVAGGTLSDKLRVFFMGEAEHHTGPILLEQEGEGQGLTRQNFKSELTKYFQEQGLDRELEALQQEVLTAKEEHAQELLSAAEAQIAALRSLSAAEGLDELEAAIASASALGVDVEGVGDQVRSLRSDLDKKRSAMPKDKSFLATIQKSLGDKKASQEDIAVGVERAAKKAEEDAVSTLRDQLSDALDEAFEEIKRQIREELTADLPEEGSPLWGVYEKTPGGKKMMAVIEDTLTKVSEGG